MIRPLVFVDLDDTLFQTRQKCPVAETAHLTQATTARNDNHSFMTRPQKAVIEWMLASADVIPVTARGSDAFRNVHLPFACGAVLANGGVLTRPDGSPDAEWTAVMSRDLAPMAASLERCLADCRAAATGLNLDIRSWIVTEDGLSIYVVFKDNADATGAGLPSLAKAAPPPPDWTIHRNGNNLAFIPGVVSKARAVAHLIERAKDENPARPILGFGDSESDFGFLSLCDLWGAPARSQIATTLEQSLADSADRG
ncbi:hypothetical protein SAMN06265338_1374 [Rhodoblastus acidophilus]|uniref:Hydroxymethylpyrimidine pyrophosphatase n=1 Tax=Rhodoblastus acidophilus TaxID=1074 RepID=A0A212SFR0_RHOAC|nr:hypothetical protein [Rhodoblastus acidophilus]PPQ34831.1 hypothetical protein CKO16_21830 [Rhodoblastus acidophilus]RAI16605.1 hypothetical protein CH337_20545 [Rhodoblastus acidophilus]SNB84555.1 hypothetical protein SAMN06265338_1374 [Rhodoblastus acidophilus]